MFTIDGLIWMLLAVVLVFAAIQQAGDGKKQMSDRTHRMVCCAALAVGVLVRLVKLSSLPAGISAEEALVGVQAKSAAADGRFSFRTGDDDPARPVGRGDDRAAAGRADRAPCRAVWHESAWTVRLPLALLSCAAMPAAYGLGEAVSGRRAARWMLILYAVCPIFVLEARLTCRSCAALYLLPIALCLLARGISRPVELYIGMVVLALTAYAQNMYFYRARPDCGMRCDCGGFRSEETPCAAGCGAGLAALRARGADGLRQI